jgi:hypothetical protein
MCSRVVKADIPVPFSRWPNSTRTGWHVSVEKTVYKASVRREMKILPLSVSDFWVIRKAELMRGSHVLSAPFLRE